MKQAFSLSLVALFLAACSGTYVPPGGKADLLVFAPPDIQAGFAVEATNPFPASMALIRVQAPAYSNFYLQQRGATP